MTYSKHSTPAPKDPIADTDKKPPNVTKKGSVNTPHADLTPKKEVGGQKGPEPTRYGDWEKNGRCTDF